MQCRSPIRFATGARAEKAIRKVANQYETVFNTTRGSEHGQKKENPMKENQTWIANLILNRCDYRTVKKQGKSFNQWDGQNVLVQIRNQ